MARSKRRRKGGPGSVEELVERAIHHLAGGRSKEALDALRKAQFKGIPAERLDRLFRRAYLLRANQLETRGLTEEAESARKKAENYGPGQGHLDPGPDELVGFLRSLSADSRLAAYGRFLRSHPPVPEVETALADHLVMNRCWEQAEVLPEGSQFRLDATVMESAIGPLDRGEWDVGHGILQRVSSSSGFWNWKVFASAMAAYLREDPAALAADLETLPSKFPLRSAVKAIRLAGTRSARNPRTPMEHIVGVGRASVARCGESLRRSAGGVRPGSFKRAITDFAQTVDPHSPEITRLRLALALGAEVESDRIGVDDYWDLCAGALPRRQHDLHEFLVFLQSIARAPVTSEYLPDIADQFDHVRRLFRAEADQRLARAQILYRLASAVKMSGPWGLPYERADAVCQILGSDGCQGVERYAQYAKAAAIDLTRASIREDPTDPAVHKSLVSMLRSDLNTSNSELIKVYEKYAEAIPEDPEPWIVVAELRLQNNAYRKAAAALEKARVYASHDNRVSDLQAASSLLAAKRNLQGKRFALAATDMAAAEASTSRTAESVVLAWKAITLYVCKNEATLPAACGRVLRDVAPAVRAKAICILLDANAAQGSLVDLPAKDWNRLHAQFQDDVRTACETAPNDLGGLLEPIPSVFRGVTSETAVSYQLSGLWDSVLRAVPDEQALTVFRVAVECGGLEELRIEIGRRLSRARNRTYQHILLLYSASIRYMLREDRGGARFSRLVESIPDEHLDPVRIAAEELSVAVARRFMPTLAMALRSFNFDLLDGSFPDLF